MCAVSGIAEAGVNFCLASIGGPRLERTLTTGATSYKRVAAVRSAGPAQADIPMQAGAVQWRNPEHWQPDV